MIGIPLAPRTPLVAEIQSRHINGIYNAIDFVKNIIPETIFHVVKVYPYHDSVTVEKFTLAKIKEYHGKYEDFKGKLQYSVAGSRNTMQFLDDLISPANGCFLDKDDAAAYEKELLEHKNQIITWV